MKYPLISIVLVTGLLFGAGPAGAVICKVVDDRGQVAYSDIPADKCPHRVKLPAYSHYAPRPLAMPGPANKGAGPAAARVVSYSGLKIQTPQDNGTVRSNQGQVSVQLEMQPALQKGHRVLWRLDGSPAGKALASNSAVLTGVERGTHSLSAQIVDANERVLGSAPTIHFTLHKESRAPASPPVTNPQKPFKPRYAPKANQSGGYAPQAGKAEKPAPAQPAAPLGNGPIPRSQGLAPAFHPNYRP